jgi:hypothetical protein
LADPCHAKLLGHHEGNVTHGHHLEKSIGPRRFYPNARFFILSLANRKQPDLRAFLIEDDRVHEQEVKVL